MVLWLYNITLNHIISRYFRLVLCYALLWWCWWEAVTYFDFVSNSNKTMILIYLSLSHLEYLWSTIISYCLLGSTVSGYGKMVRLAVSLTNRLLSNFLRIVKQDLCKNTSSIPSTLIYNSSILSNRNYLSMFARLRNEVSVEKKYYVLLYHIFYIKNKSYLESNRNQWTLCNLKEVHKSRIKTSCLGIRFVSYRQSHLAGTPHVHVPCTAPQPQEIPRPTHSLTPPH